MCLGGGHIDCGRRGRGVFRPRKLFIVHKNSTPRKQDRHAVCVFKWDLMSVATKNISEEGEGISKKARLPPQVEAQNKRKKKKSPKMWPKKKGWIGKKIISGRQRGKRENRGAHSVLKKGSPSAQ